MSWNRCRLGENRADQLRESEFQRMGKEMREMRENLERVIHKMTPRSGSENSAPDAVTIPVEASNRLRSLNESLPDPTIDHITPASSADSIACRGPTSSGFIFDVARESLQAIGVNAVQPGTPSHEDELAVGLNPRYLLGDYGQLKRLLTKDPLWLMDRPSVFRLLEIWGNGPGALYSLVHIDKLRSRWDSLYSMMASAPVSQSTEKFLLLAEAMSNNETVVLKLVLANSLLLECGGMNETAQRLFESTGGASQRSVWDAPNLSNIVILALTVGVAVSQSASTADVPLQAILYYHLDDEVRASRAISAAARLCLELGLNRAETLQMNVTDKDDRSAASVLFWSIYMLDRRSCIGLGVPFVMQDSDIDTSLPQPVSDMYEERRSQGPFR